MVFVFGVDVPLVELILGFSLISFIMLIEITVVMIILFYQLRHSREITTRLERVTHVLLHIGKKDLKKLKESAVKEQVVQPQGRQWMKYNPFKRRK